MAKFHPFTKGKKNYTVNDWKAPASMHKLTSGAWKVAREVKKVRMPKGS